MVASAFRNGGQQIRELPEDFIGSRDQFCVILTLSRRIFHKESSRLPAEPFDRAVFLRCGNDYRHAPKGIYAAEAGFRRLDPLVGQTRMKCPSSAPPTWG